ncbi:MAG: hypothetical protein ACOYW7_00505 [Nitrospirota bacterium]
MPANIGTSRIYPESLSENRWLVQVVNIDKSHKLRSNAGVAANMLKICRTLLVRIVKPEMKKEVKQLGAVAGDPEEKFDYIEHLL